MMRVFVIPEVLRRAWVVVLFLILLVGAGILYWWQLAVPAILPTIGPAVQAVYASGSVEATQTISISPRVAGKLVTLLVDEGDVVEAGQVLATIESDDMQAQTAQLRARALYARTALKRAEKLLPLEAISQDAYEQAKQEFSAAYAALKQAEAQLGYSQLVALQAGMVVQRDGEIGSYVAVGQPVFWLASGPLRVTAQVDEEDIIKIKPSLPVLLRSDNLPLGTVVSSTVIGVTPRGDTLARSFRVRMALPENTPLKIGMTVETNIILSQNSRAVLLPHSAIKDNIVAVVSDGKIVLQPVVVGSVGASLTEIVSGISAKDIVLESMSDEIKNGDSVRIHLIDKKGSLDD